jgi:SHS2 domain-containing protein
VGTFEILPHTADVGFRARGASLSDLFETAAQAMFSIEYNTSTVGFELELDVTADADDLEGLLVAWLSELLWIHDAKGFVAGDFLIVELGQPPMGRVGGAPLMARGVARGREIGDWFEQIGPQIKAVTLHGLEIIERRGNYEATVYLDV